MRTAADAQSLIGNTAAAVKHAWIALVVRLRAANPPDALQHRLHAMEPVLGTDPAARALAAAYTSQFVATGAAVAADATQQSAASVRKDVGSPADVIGFDPIAQGVLTWAERNRLDLIRGITSEQRIMIRFALSEAQSSGESPLTTARVIQESIGLSEQQLEWVQSFERSLRAGQLSAAADRALVDGRTARMLRTADELAPAQIDRAVSRYRDKMITFRAQTIARTEASRIVGQGTTEMYDQAIERGDLVATQLECTWNHSPTAKDHSHDRDFHVSMHKQTRAWGEPFVSGLGNELMYPCDPDAEPKETVNCRCARTVRLRPRRSLV